MRFERLDRSLVARKGVADWDPSTPTIRIHGKRPPAATPMPSASLETLDHIFRRT